MPYTPTVYVNNTTPALNATNLNKSETGIQTAQAAVEALAGKYGHILLDDVAGADDDAKLTSALTTAAAATYPPVIQFSNRQYTFTQRGRTPYEGMRLQGPFGFNNPERNSGTKTSNRLTLNFDSSSDNQGWFHLPTSTSLFGVSMDNLVIDGATTQALFLTSASDTALWKNLYIRNLYATDMRGVLGRSGQALCGDAQVFEGAWQINNGYDTAIHLKGSDSTFLCELQLDSSTSANSTGGSNGHYQMILDFADKLTFAGSTNITCEGGWNGVKILGPANPRTSSSNNAGRVWATNWRVEGRNKGAACNGSVIRIEGGALNLHNAWVSYGMVSAATPGHSPQDAGIIHMEGGVLHATNLWYDRATGVAETVPFIYNNNGFASNRWAEYTSGGGTWTGVPRYALAGTGTMDTDSTMTT
jgi:hypothetical protein